MSGVNYYMGSSVLNHLDAFVHAYIAMEGELGASHNDRLYDRVIDLTVPQSVMNGIMEGLKAFVGYGMPAEIKYNGFTFRIKPISGY